MTAPGQGRRAGTPSRPAGAKGKTRDKGTRGGRPEAPSAAARRGAGAGRAATGRNGAGNGQTAPGAGTTRARSGDGKPLPTRSAVETAATGARVPAWLLWTTLVLSLAGLGVAVYLTIVHFSTKVTLACPESSTINCQKVTTSPESWVFGIPVAVLGLAFFVFLVAITTPWAWRGTGPFARFGALTGRVRLGSLILGMIFVIYLVYTEVITLSMTICLWCTAIHVITFILFVLVVYAATAGYGVTKPTSAR